MLSQEEKLRILKAIEDDSQFRYALMGFSASGASRSLHQAGGEAASAGEAIKQLQTTLITFDNRFGVLIETAFRNAITGYS